jgi:hypothetical protein
MTPENYARAAERLLMLQQPIGVAPSDDAPAPSLAARALEVIIDTGRTKRTPRTLQEAFPISEGYRFAAGRLAADGSLQPLNGPMPRRPLLSYVTTDRVCWGIVLCLAGWLCAWAWLAPKGHP